MNNIEICLVYSLNIPDKSLWYITIVWKTWLHLASIHTKIHHPQLNTKYKRKGKGDLYLLKLATISGPQVQEMAAVMVQGKIFTLLHFGPDLFLVLHGLKKRNDSFVWLWLWHKNKICLFTWQFLDFSISIQSTKTAILFLRKVFFHRLIFQFPICRKFNFWNWVNS